MRALIIGSSARRLFIESRAEAALRSLDRPETKRRQWMYIKRIRPLYM
jgi:hypothetical protein